MDIPHRSSHNLFSVGDVGARRLAESDLQALQDFFVANPDYFLVVNGKRPRADEARQEFEDCPPPEMPFDEVFVIGFADSAGRLLAMASVISNLLAEHVWHIGLFIVATSLHKLGTAAILYAGLEAWLKERGASGRRGRQRQGRALLGEAWLCRGQAPYWHAVG
ncbi:MAG TPA: GNAT family N-acetyltransferase [Oxalobacteraceae bacterium]|nr:GNAT family N-acetyltransferase [Oxalobacteraceae bacterium]